MKVAVVITHPAELAGMTRWAALLAGSVAGDDGEGGDLTLLLGEGVDPKAVREVVDGWAAESGAAPKLEIAELGRGDFLDAVVEQVDKVGVGLLVVGKNRYPDAASERSSEIGRRLFDLAPCDTMLLRLGSEPVKECDSVLVPSAGGPHSLAALRLAHQVVGHWGGKMTALYVERGMHDEDGEAVGEIVLERTLVEAGIAPAERDRVRCRILTNESADAGIRQAAEAGSYDLLILGSPTSLGLKRKLFGTVPDHLLGGGEAMAVAAIRARRPATYRIRERFERFLRLRVPQLERDDRVALFERLQTHSRWNFDFMTLITLSTAIAALGLVVDSTAVVIGAMLVAPLMTPLLGAGLALVQGNLPLMRTCAKAIAFGFLAALLVGVLIGAVAPLTRLTHELGARGSVRIEDMGIAFLSGVAAAYCVARPGLSSALAGVAIAAALVPPIATVGISLALGEFLNAQGAAQLFTVNVVSIVLGAAINFYLAGIRARTPKGGSVWVRRTVVTLVICATILLVPMTSVVISKLSERLLSSRSVLGDLESSFTEILKEENIVVQQVTIFPLSREKERISVRCELIAPQHPEEAALQQLADAARKRLGGELEVDLQVTTRLSTTVSSTSASATP